MAVWCVTGDPCGIFCANFTLLLLLYAEFVIVKVVLIPWYGFTWHIVAYSTCTLLAVISHIRCQYSDPGAIPKTLTVVPDRQPLVPPQPNPPSSQLPLCNIGLGYDICRRCRTVKPDFTHHCSTCARCIAKMDHHCPWVNNCVAAFNQKYFVLFLFYTAVCCVYSAGLLIGRFVTCTHRRRAAAGAIACVLTGGDVVFCILNFIEAIMFGLFVTIMLCDQLSAIFANTPGIDALQGKLGEKKSRMETLKDVFGESFSYRWLLPTSLPRKVFDEFYNNLPCIGSEEDDRRST